MKFTVQNRAKVCLIISAAILVIALLMTVIGAGLNKGIDFSGGVALRYDMGEVFDVEAVRVALTKQGMGGAQIIAGSAPQQPHDHEADPNHEHIDDEAAKTQLEVRVKALRDPDAAPAALEAALRETYPLATFVIAENIGAAAGDGLMGDARLCALIACALLLIYVAIRFDLLTGVAAALGMLHDVLLLMALVVILRIPVDAAFFAVPLAIAGYSIANILVLFARVRETNGKSSARNLSREEIVTRSVQEMLPRTLGIAVVTLLVTASLWIFGAAPVKAIALPLFLGMLGCIYSTTMLTGYVWAWLFKLRGNRKT